MARRPPAPGTTPRWGVAVIIAGAGLFAGLLPVAVNRGPTGEAPQAAVGIFSAPPAAGVPSTASSAPQSPLGEPSPEASSPSHAARPTTSPAAAGTSPRVEVALPTRRPA